MIKQALFVGIFYCDFKIARQRSQFWILIQEAYEKFGSDDATLLDILLEYNSKAPLKFAFAVASAIYFMANGFFIMRNALRHKPGAELESPFWRGVVFYIFWILVFNFSIYPMAKLALSASKCSEDNRVVLSLIRYLISSKMPISDENGNVLKS